MPGRTGPVTPDGKRRASLNRLTHGLRFQGLLPCKRDQCFYRSRCQMPDKQPDRWAATAYGEPCPLELDYANAWRKSDLQPGRFWSPDERELLDELILASIMQQRADKALFIVMKGDMARGCVLLHESFDATEEAMRIARLRRRIQGRYRRVRTRALPTILGINSVERYMDNVVESMTRKHPDLVSRVGGASTSGPDRGDSASPSRPLRDQAC